MKQLSLFSFVLIFASGFSAVRADFMMPVPVPFEQMETHLRKLLAEKPEDPEVLYRLGRVHYLAFQMGVGVSYTFRPEEPGTALPERPFTRHLVESMEAAAAKADPGAEVNVGRPFGGGEWSVTVMHPEERVGHALLARKFLSQAMEKGPDRGLSFLTYGWFVQTWLDHPELGKLPEAEPLSDLKVDTALTAYQKAFELERATDRKRKFLPLEGPEAMVSREAALSWLALAKEIRPADSKQTMLQMHEHVAWLSNLPMGAITPVMFHPDKKAGDPVPVDASQSVEFDMAGDGSGGRWTWPQTGSVLLVWNPAGTAKILNGSQLFGGYTWEMFWEHGFEALRILDVNRDGVLRGGELSALSGWTDAPPFGTCQPGELAPLSESGVMALHLEHRAFEGEEALVWNPAGVEMKDGSRLPLWDWLAQPAQGKAE